MDTTAAATQAHVTVATIRAWCRRGVIAAIKVAGRWVIEAASLARRISLGKKTMTITPLTRGQFEAAAIELGIRHPVKDARCYGEYRTYTRTGEYYIDDEYNRLMVARGAALASEGYEPPAAKRGPGHAPGLPGQIFGGPSAGRANECHYCGLDPHTCDCR